MHSLQYLALALLVTGACALAPRAQADVCSQNTNSTTLVFDTSVACNDQLPGQSYTFDNRYLRRFSPNTDCFAAGGILLTELGWGVDEANSATGTQPASLRFYSLDPGDALLFANLTLLHEENVSVADGDTYLIQTVLSQTVFVPGGQDLVVEIFTPDGTPVGNSLFVGSNDLGQSGPTYLATNECGLLEPTDLATIGFPDMALFLNLVYEPLLGSTYCDAVANSTGKVAVLSAQGSLFASDNDLTLTVTDGVPGEFVFIIGSFGQASILNPGGGSIVGRLCVGGGEIIARFVGANGMGQPTGATDTLGMFDGNGSFSTTLDIHNVPLSSTPGMNTVLVGTDIFHFQAFYRDTPAGAGTGNFSTALQIAYAKEPKK